MSLAGLAISIGVLVDSSIVMAENVMHRLKTRYGDQPRPRRHPRRRPGRVPRGRPADLLLGAHHAALVPAGVRPWRAGREDVPSRWRYTKSFAMLGVGSALDHARPGAVYGVRQGPAAVRGGSRAGPSLDAGLSPGAELPSRPPGGDRLVRRADVRPRGRAARGQMGTPHRGGICGRRECLGAIHAGARRLLRPRRWCWPGSWPGGGSRRSSASS